MPDKRQSVSSPCDMGLRRRSIISKNVFSEKFATTSRLVVSSKVWLDMIPTRNCDVLIMFRRHTDEQTLSWLLARLRARCPELLVRVHHHRYTDCYGFYLTADYQSLLQGAEELSIRKTVKMEYGGGMKEFVLQDKDYFLDSDNSKHFFTSQERQTIVKNMLVNLRAHHGDRVNNITFLEGQAIVPVLLSKRIISQVFPLHNTEDLKFLQDNWVQAVFRRQPLEKVCEYFGVKIALYFCYLGHYTKSLLYPALLGLIFWLTEGRHQYSDDICFVIFAFFNVIWATVYLESWKRRSAEMAFKWGTLDKEDDLLVEPRALHYGKIMKSAVTGRYEAHYPAWKRNLFRYLISLPVIISCLSAVFVVMWFMLEVQHWVDTKVKAGSVPFFFSYLPRILLALCITVLDDIYKKIAVWLNNKENHRLDITYEKNLIVKLVLFQFVNSFLSLFYIGFYVQDMDQLKTQLAALLITRQVVGNLKEALLPYVVDKARLLMIGYSITEGLSPDSFRKELKEMSSSEFLKRIPSCVRDLCEEDFNRLTVNTDQCPAEDEQTGGQKIVGDDGELHHSGLTLTQAEIEAALLKYEDTFEDYLEMFIQFGYVTLFSSAFPMAAMCALINNIIEIRSDAFKLCMTFQRPFGQRVESIGIWQSALELMSVVAIMVNCALIGMSGLADRFLPNSGTAEKIVFIVVLEHIVLGLKLLVAYAIPDIPHHVAEEKARLEFLRRDALKNMKVSTRLSRR